jgi:hypothetical protein
VVAAINAIAEGRVDVMPDVLVTGGGNSVEGLAASLIRYFTAAGSEGGGSGRENGQRDVREGPLPPPPSSPELPVA